MMPISLPQLLGTRDRDDAVAPAAVAHEGASAPRHPDVHFVDSPAGPHLFVANGSQLYRVNSRTADALKAAVESIDSKAVNRLLARLGVETNSLIDDAPISSPPLHSLSLAIAQKCNLGCSYCYADQGDFGGRPIVMSVE